MDHRHARLGLLLLCGGAALTYAASLSGGYVYEDVNVAPALAVPEAFRRLVGPRGLTSLSYALSDAGPMAARAVSLGWHLLNGVLLWLVARKAVTEAAAVLAAGVFLLLPIQTEAVAAVAYRAELVTGTWLLLAMLCASRGWVVAAWVCAAGTVTGKEAGVIALALVPLWACWTGPRWTRRQMAGWVLASLVPCALLVRWFVTHNVPLFQSWEGMALSVGAAGRLAEVTLRSVLQPGVLSIDHDWAPMTPEMGVASGALWLFLVCLSSGWWRPALLWAGVALSLRVTLTLPELHEHHLYSAVILVSVAVGATVFPERSAWLRTSTKNIPARCTSPAR